MAVAWDEYVTALRDALAGATCHSSENGGVSRGRALKGWGVRRRWGGGSFLSLQLFLDSERVPMRTVTQSSYLRHIWTHVREDVRTGAGWGIALPRNVSPALLVGEMQLETPGYPIF